jgi:hypothetical protein
MQILLDILKSKSIRDWSLIGLLLGIAFFVYSTFIYERRPELRIDLLNNSPVYDLKEDVPLLQIIFHGEDLKKQNNTLSLMTTRISNAGNASILLTHYDERDPLSITLDNVRIIKLDVVDASNHYLSQNVADWIHIYNDKIEFTPIILDPGDYFSLKILVIHSIGHKPEISAAAGKIAGINKIQVNEQYRVDRTQTFFDDIISGGPLVHIFRAILYGFILPLFIAFFMGAVLTSNMMKKVEVFRRSRIVKNFAILYPNKITDLGKKVLDNFCKYGLGYIFRVRYLFKSDDNIKQFSNKIKEYELNGKKNRQVEYAVFDLFNDIIKIENEKIFVDPEVKSLVDDFTIFLGKYLSKKEIDKINMMFS